MSLKKQKLDRYIQETVETFQSESILEKVCNIQLVEQQTSEYIQIGLRKQIPIEKLHSNSVVLDFYFKDIARAIAIAEKDYLIKNALNAASESLSADENGFSIIFHQVHERSFNDPILFIPVSYFYKVMFQNKVNDIEFDNKLNRFVFYFGTISVPIFLFTTPELKEKMILADREAITCYSLLGEKYNGFYTRLKIDKKEGEGQVDFTFKTVSKIDFALKPIILKLGEK